MHETAPPALRALQYWHGPLEWGHTPTWAVWALDNGEVAVEASGGLTPEEARKMAAALIAAANRKPHDWQARGPSPSFAPPVCVDCGSDSYGTLDRFCPAPLTWA